MKQPMKKGSFVPKKVGWGWVMKGWGGGVSYRGVSYRGGVCHVGVGWGGVSHVGVGVGWGQNSNSKSNNS